MVFGKYMSFTQLCICLLGSGCMDDTKNILIIPHVKIQPIPNGFKCRHHLLKL